VTGADPELAAGADDDPSEPELDVEPEPVADEPGPVEEDPESSEEDPESSEEDPESFEPADSECFDAEPVRAAEDVPAVLLAVLCVVPGRLKATTPAAARPTIPVPAVTPRSRRRARSRATMADTVRSSLLGMRTPFHGRAVT
jgi:hypothetical protein